jgi:isopenicillin N synthase-like dioxygenase
MLLATKLARCFSSALSVPIVDVNNFLKRTGNYDQDCKTVA